MTKEIVQFNKPPNKTEVTDAAIGALGKSETIYWRGFSLVCVVDASSVPEDKGRICKIQLADERYVIEEVEKQIDFCSPDKIGNPKWCSAPIWLAPTIRGRGEWPGVRPLEAVVDYPCVLRDGSVMSGFNKYDRGILSRSRNEVELREPGDADSAKESCERLLEPFGDFPFERPNHRSALLAAILTMVGRHAFRGPCPMFVFDKNAPGTGGTLLADAVSVIVRGTVMPHSPFPPDSEELRKRITSHLMACDPAVLFDNISGTLGGSVLNLMLTSEKYQDRLLGTNTTIDVAAKTIWFATGNNIMFGADTSRRCLLIRMWTKEERPEQRTGFKIPDLLAHLEEHGARLLDEAIHILRSWIAAGRPRCDVESWGSFDGWNQCIRSCLLWAGQPDPRLIDERLVEQGDPHLEALRAIVANWERFAAPTGELKASQVLDRAWAESAGEAASAIRTALEILEPAGGRGGRPNSVAIGNRVTSLVGRVASGKQIVARSISGTRYYRVV